MYKRIFKLFTSLILLLSVFSCSKFELLAGSEKEGFINGTVIEAKFDNPTSMAVDDNSNLYVVDQNNKVIRKITPEGKVSTFLDYTNEEYELASVTIKDNFLYFIYGYSIRRINLNSPEIEVENIVGSSEIEIGVNNSQDIIGDFDIARFERIDAISFDNNNNLFILDNSKIKKASLDTRQVEKLKFRKDGSTTYFGGESLINRDDTSIIGRGNTEMMLVNPQNNQIYLKISETFSQRICRINENKQIVLYEISPMVTGSFIFDQSGNMYVVSIEQEKLLKITPDNNIEEITHLGGILNIKKTDDFPEFGIWDKTHLAIDNKNQILYMSTFSNKIFKLNLKR